MHPISDVRQLAADRADLHPLSSTEPSSEDFETLGEFYPHGDYDLLTALEFGAAFARRMDARRQQLTATTHVSTDGIRVRILHPRYRFVEPHYRAGIIRLPGCIFTPDYDWRRTWRHELQHAHDDRAGLLSTLTSAEAEARARAAEHLTVQ